MGAGRNTSGYFGMHIACGAGDAGISAAAHLPLEIVRSGTASIASILPQGQVSAAPTPPTPLPPLTVRLCTLM